MPLSPENITRGKQHYLGIHDPDPTVLMMKPGRSYDHSAQRL